MNDTKRRQTRAIALILGGVALAACGEEAVEVDDALIADMALVAADATIEDVTLWSQPLGFSTPMAAPDASGTQAVPGRPGGRDGFSGSFSGTRSVTFYDEEGMEQESYDPVTTESIHILHEIEGEVSRDGWSASIHRERDKTVSGLAGEETTRTWNGTGSQEVSRSRHLDDGSERSYEMEGSSGYEAVVVPIPGSDSRWPLSGTVTRSMTVTRTGPDGEVVTRSIEIVVTFNGTQMATVIVNGEEMEIDLAERDGRNPVRRRDR